MLPAALGVVEEPLGREQRPARPVGVHEQGAALGERPLAVKVEPADVPSPSAATATEAAGATASAQAAPVTAASGSCRPRRSNSRRWVSVPRRRRSPAIAALREISPRPSASAWPLSFGAGESRQSASESPGAETAEEATPAPLAGTRAVSR
jgi:hypothetical protein